jgi:hypothetical protein
LAKEHRPVDHCRLIVTDWKRRFGLMGVLELRRNPERRRTLCEGGKAYKSHGAPPLAAAKS